MSTIQQQRRRISAGLKPNGVSCGFVIPCAIALVFLSYFHILQAQDVVEAPATSNAQRYADDDRSFDEVNITSKDMKVDLIEGAVKVLSFQEKIVRVDGFDENVMSVDAVSPTRLRIQGREQNVTTMLVTGESNRKYTIHIYVTGDARYLTAILQRHFPNSTIKCSKLTGGNILLTGYVTDARTITNILDVARLYAPEVINHMSVGGSQEVQLRVKILEVQRSKIRTFGMDLQGLGQNAVIASTPANIAPLTSLINPIGGNVSTAMQPSSSNLPSLTAGFNTNHFAFNAFLQALKEEGLLKFHTTPMLITRSGEPARLNDGGEFPIPVPGGLGTVTIQFQEFGVTLEALPIVISPTRVRNQVKVVVSDKDVSNSITLLGTTVPGLSKRELFTTIEMNFGETMVVGGLLNRREQGTTLKQPFLGELPLIGAAFRKVNFTEGETELIIMITPEYGASMTADQIPPGGPGQSTTVPTDKELYGHGLIEVPKIGPDCGPDCYNNGFMRGNPSDCNPSGNGFPAQRSYGPEPSINPMINPNPINNPNSGGLITPKDSDPSDYVPPAPNSSAMMKRPGARSNLASKSRSKIPAKQNPSSEPTDFDTVQPAGFQKSSKTQRDSRSGINN